MNNEINFDRHREITQFVGLEVYHCISELMSEMTSKAEHFPDYEGDLLDAWHAPFSEADYCNAYVESVVSGMPVDMMSLPPRPDHCDTWQEACELHDINPINWRREVYEHWIVSDWLANRLEERGERVLRDFFGLTVWGRTCEDQDIACDYVIGQIFDELHRKVGH